MNRFFDIMIIITQMESQNQKGNKSGHSRSNTIVIPLPGKDIFDSGYPKHSAFKRTDDGLPTPFSFLPRLSERQQQVMTTRSEADRMRVKVKNEQDQYARECLEYEKYRFDERIREIIHRIASRAYSRTNNILFSRFFLQRTLSILAKKFHFNRFQLLFLDYVFDQTGWGVDNEVIKAQAKRVRLYVRSAEETNAQSLQLYLLYCGYYAKAALNQSNLQSYFADFLNSIIDNFKFSHHEWIQSTNINKPNIKVKIINMIFKQIILNGDRDYIENYDTLTESILEISPAYNATKQNKPRQKKVREVERQIVQEEGPQQILEDDDDQYNMGQFQINKRISYSSNME